MYKLILFDIGHVLVKLTGASLIQRFARTQLADQHIHATWTSVPGVQQFETGVCDEVAFATSVVEFYDLSCSTDEFAHHFRHAAESKFDGVDAFLATLADQHELACLTNTNPLQWPRISEELGLGAYFAKQYVSYEIGLMKPDAAIYNHVIEDARLAPEEILFIDDNAHNCSAAEARGIDTCHVASFADTQAQVLGKLARANSRAG